MSNNVSAIFEGLNSEQKKAVESVEGPVLIVAGAGSGKTRVLTSRIAYILERGCEAGRVMALTFTKKAAGEMKERIAQMVGVQKARHLYMGTFHSIFIRFLRENAALLGYPESFTIYDTSDSISAVKACIKELQLDDKVYKPKDVLARISMAKNNLCTANAYRNNPNIIQSDIHSKRPKLCDVYSKYVEKCKQSGVMDFDDILLNMNILLRDHPEACEAIANRFSYILVDEYQDTNYAQYLILRKLSQFHHNICVVGDDSQSIYAFRGAKIENILNFKKDYPDCKIFRLECNYRSTQTIVEAANSLIEKNSGRIPKVCYSQGPVGEKIRLIRAYTEQEEAILIVSSIMERMRDEGAMYQDFAILYRVNSQSRALEEALRRRNIPYMIYSGNSFFERAEIKDMMAYFKLVVNVNDDESFKRICNRPARGIGDTSMMSLMQVANAHQTSLFKAVFAEDAEAIGLKSASIQKLRAFCLMINDLAQKLHTVEAHDLALEIATKSGLYAMFKEDTSIEGMARTANIDELLNSVATFVEERQNEMIEESDEDIDEAQLPLVRLDEYLENVSLLSNVDVADDEDSSNKVALMTVHSAKGLEFMNVFVAGMEENLFPSGGHMATPDQIEEERRLFYVALTRAKKSIALSYTDTRMRNGKHESNSVSRFLKEIAEEYLANPLRADLLSSSKEEDELDLGAKVGFGGRGTFGSRGAQSYYGRSSDVRIEKRQPGQFRQSSPARSVPSASAQRPSASPRPSAGTAQFQGKASVLGRPLPPKVPDADFIPSPMHEMKAGSRIEHNRFGKGTILSITGNVPELKAQISFDEYGDKTIMLKYAKMRLI